MTKNIVLLAKRRQDIETDSGSFLIANGHGLRSKETTFIESPKKIKNNIEEKAQVVIFRKINSLRNNNKNNKINFDSRNYLKNKIIYSNKPQTDFKPTVNSPKRIAKSDDESYDTENLESSFVKSHRTAIDSNNVDNKRQQHHDECLFCKYEKIISSNKIPNFARKRLVEIFQSLTKPEVEHEELIKLPTKSKLRNKSFNNSTTKSNISLNSMLTTSQILEF